MRSTITNSNTNAQLPTIDFTDITGDSKILRWALQDIGLDSPKEILRLFLIIFVPFVILSIATLLEGRFWYGSVTSDTALDGYVILGMSFMGDTMVWPYMLLIPVTLIMLRAAIGRTTHFFDEIRHVLSKSFVAEHQAEYENLISAAKRDFSAKGPWKIVYRGAVIVATMFVLWNALTCTFTDVLYPYSSETVIILQDSKTVAHQADQLVDIPKWDTDYRGGTASWLFARIWVLLAYGVVPLMLYKVINLMGGVYMFCSRLTTYSKSLQIKPLAPDGAGGLSSLANAALSFMYTFVPILFMAVAAFFKEATPASPHNYILVVVFLPLLVSAFFMPLSAVHAAMRQANDQYLTKISRHYNRHNDDLLNQLAKGELVAGHLEDLARSVESLKRMYTEAEQLPVWPMEINILLKFLATIALPIALFLAQELLRDVL